MFLPTTTTELGAVTPVVQQQSVDTQDKAQGSTQPPIVMPLSPPVPSGETEDPKPTPLSVVFEQQPSTTQFGSVVAPTVSIEVRDQYGDVLPNADVKLFPGTNPTGAALSGTTGTTDTNGIATFPALSISASGTYSNGITYYDPAGNGITNPSRTAAAVTAWPGGAQF